MSILGHNALDIAVSKADLCLILGYLATPGRVGYVEAQIPEEKAFLFEREFPNEPYYPITQGQTTGGYLMKQGCQLRIYFNNIDNCPSILRPLLGVGTGTYVKRINKGKFVERIVKNYGFSFGDRQSVTSIQATVKSKHPNFYTEFEKGYNL